MNRFLQRQTRAAFSLIELLVVISVVAVCMGILLLPSRGPWVPATRIACVNNLKQVGLAFRIFAEDHGNKFPMQLSASEGGTLPFVEGPYTFRHFQTLSNELGTPKILLCPADRQRALAATNFSMDFSDNKLSYFLGIDATPTNAQAFLSGDRNITIGFPARNGVLLMITNQMVKWTPQIHEHVGNICLADGSVQQLTSSALQRGLANTGLPTNRLVVP